MPLTCYCKQCGREVPPMEACQVCGSKLNPNQAHVMWRIVRQPVLDWMCWNAVMRIVLPVLTAVVLLAGWMEVLSGGWSGVEALIRSELPMALGVLLAALVLAVAILLLLRGKELLVCTVDGKGVHIERYLPDANRMKLLFRLKPPTLLDELPKDGPRGLLALDRQDLPWKSVARVQLWPEKSLVLFYAPSWWQRMALPCSAFTWPDTLQMIRQKIGKKKHVILPKNLRESGPAPKNRSAAPAPVHAARHARPFEGMEGAEIVGNSEQK